MAATEIFGVAHTRSSPVAIDHLPAGAATRSEGLNGPSPTVASSRRRRRDSGSFRSRRTVAAAVTSNGTSFLGGATSAKPVVAIVRRNAVSRPAITTVSLTRPGTTKSIDSASTGVGFILPSGVSTPTVLTTRPSVPARTTRPADIALGLAVAITVGARENDADVAPAAEPSALEIDPGGNGLAPTTGARDRRAEGGVAVSVRRVRIRRAATPTIGPAPPSTKPAAFVVSLASLSISSKIGTSVIPSGRVGWLLNPRTASRCAPTITPVDCRSGRISMTFVSLTGAASTPASRAAMTAAPSSLLTDTPNPIGVRSTSSAASMIGGAGSANPSIANARKRVGSTRSLPAARRSNSGDAVDTPTLREALAK